jgi:hypothetical protein
MLTFAQFRVSALDFPHMFTILVPSTSIPSRNGENASLSVELSRRYHRRLLPYNEQKEQYR